MSLITIPGVSKVVPQMGEHSVVVRALGMYWGGARFESLSTLHCWVLSKSFIPRLVVGTAIGGEKQKQKSNVEQSNLCDLEQITAS